MAEQPPRDLPTLASKIRYLFETVHPPGRGPYTDVEVAAAVEADGQVTMSESFLYSLRSGRRDNPSLSRLGALAKFFGVDPNFFFDDAVTQAVTEELAFVAALRDSGVKGLAMRAAGLSEFGLEQLQQMAELVRRVEGLPAPTGGTPLSEQSRSETEPATEDFGTT